MLMLINTEVYCSIIAHYRKRRNPLDKNLFLNRLKLLKPPQSDSESKNLLRNKDTIRNLTFGVVVFTLLVNHDNATCYD